MFKYRFLLIGSILILGAMILAACGGGANTAEITVDMEEFMFNPQDYTVPAGAEVTIHMINSGALEHEFTIVKLGERLAPPVDEASVEDKIFWEHELPAGESETLTFTAPSEPGEYQIVCIIPGHLEQGMEAKLIVE